MDAERRTRLDDLLAERGLGAVWLARPASFAWATGGSNVVDRSAPVGVAAAGYDGDGLRVVTNNVEADRLREEELPADAAVETYDWHAGSLAGAVADASPTPAAADFDVPAGGFRGLDAAPLRQPLTSADVERYRELGRDTAAAVEAVCRDLDPSDAEREVAGRLRAELDARGIAAPVALVGSAERAGKYRHFTPKDRELGAYALVSVTAERGGLHASCTRTVAFDPPEWLAERHRGAARVEASALAATWEVAREGGRASEVFPAIKAAYEAVGHEGEWHRHHQGGAAGFAGREWFVGPDADGPVTTPMAYAYNPTIRGAKSEDTVLVTDDGFEVLTATGNWPTEPAEACGFDVELPRQELLKY